MTPGDFLIAAKRISQIEEGVRLTCTRCGKRLSRKTARQIDGKPLCSTCMFTPKPRKAV